MFYLIDRIFGKRMGLIISGFFGILVGIFFLYLNLSSPDTASNSDWFWCIVGLVAGVFLLVAGFLRKK